MAAVFASAIDKPCFASLEAADADAAVALFAAAALLADFAMSACSLLTWLCRSSIRASRGLRSVQPAVTTAKVKSADFAFSFTPFSLSKAHRPKCKYGHSRIAIQRTFCPLNRKGANPLHACAATTHPAGGAKDNESAVFA